MTIIQKLKPCKGCLKLSKIFSKGCCLACSKKTFKAIKHTSVRGVAKRQEERSEYPEFFIEAIRRLQLNPVCQETGQPIYNPASLNCSHIFPKRKYKSVALNFDNIIFLSWEKHTELDSYLDCIDLEKVRTKLPKVFEIMKERFKILEPLILEHGKLLEACKIYFK